MPISNETANKLLQGEFKTFDELYDFNNRDTDYDDKITILFREVINTNRNEFIYIIETVFIDE